MAHTASAILAFSVAVSMAPLASAAAGACSVDNFPIDRTVLTVSVCLPDRGARKLPVGSDGQVQETLSVRGRPPLMRSTTYSRLPNEATARTIDDVPLQSLGIGKTLHLTLAVHAGAARLEHALLIPGAIALK